MPIVHSGRKVNYGLAIESVRGTAVDPQIWCRYETGDFFDTATTTLNKSALNVLNQNSGAEVTETWAAGQLAGKVTDHAIGFILYGVFGSYAVQAHSGETVVYDHTFTESNTNLAQSLTITRSDPNTNLQYAGAMVNSFELDVKAGDFVRHITQFVSQPNTTPGAESPVYLAYENEFIAKHVTVKFAGTNLDFVDATAIPVASAKLVVNKNVNPYWIVGQTNPGEIYADSVEITGELVLRYDAQTYYTQRFNNTLQAMQLDIKNSGVTIGSAAHPEIVLTMPATYLTDFKVNNNLDGIVEQTLSFTAVHDLTNGYSLKGVLTNKHSTYASAGVS